MWVRIRQLPGLVPPVGAWTVGGVLRVVGALVVAVFWWMVIFAFASVFIAE